MSSEPLAPSRPPPRLKVESWPRQPKLTFDTVLYTFTNKPHRCYWCSGSSSETKVMASSQPQDNPHPLTSLLAGAPCRRALGGRLSEWGGCAGGWGVSASPSASSRLSLWAGQVLPTVTTAPTSVSPAVFVVLISRSFSSNHVAPTSQLKTTAFSLCFFERFLSLLLLWVKHLSFNVLYFVHFYVTYHVNRQRQ